MTAFKAMKKPIVVDVWEIDGTENYPEWAKGIVGYIPCNIPHPVTKETLTIFEVHTIEGIMSAQVGDFLLKGIKGELYPCRRDIFLETYERVEE